MKCFYNKYFILLIEEPNNLDSFQLNKKISDYLEPIQNEVLHVIFNSNITPNNFKEISHEKLAKAYVKIYTNLLYLKNTFPSNSFQFSEDADERNKKAHSTSKIRNVVNLGIENSNRDSDEESKEESETEPPVTKKLKTQEFVELATAGSTSKTASITHEDKEGVKREEDDEARLQETLNTINQSLFSGQSPLSDHNILKPFPSLTQTSSNGNSVLSNNGGAFAPAKSGLSQATSNSSTKVGIQDMRDSSMLSKMGVFNGMLPKKQAALPTIPQAIPVSNVQPAQMQQNNQNKVGEMDLNLLLAFQHEQMKNQVLMNYLYQNVNNGGDINKLELMRLAGSLGMMGNMNSNGQSMNSGGGGNDVKTEFVKNDIASLLMANANSGNNMNNSSKISNNINFQQQAQQNSLQNMTNLNNSVNP